MVAAQAAHEVRRVSSFERAARQARGGAAAGGAASGSDAGCRSAALDVARSDSGGSSGGGSALAAPEPSWTDEAEAEMAKAVEVGSLY